jgi:lysophospholipid acyltransferase (LPLAT)-like uncharacterized protein
VRAFKVLIKKILKSDAVMFSACWLAAQYMRLAWYSGRWEIKGKENIDKLYDAGKPCIVCLWHGRLLMSTFGWQREKPLKMLISAHRDGALIANTVKHVGIDHITGSTSKGGTAALRNALRSLKAGEYVGITPDGPRGPRMRISTGVMSLAKLSGLSIVPITFSVKRGKCFGSWDRFLLAYPFSRGVIQWGEPMLVPKDADQQGLAALQERLEEQMNTLTYNADIYIGRDPVEPAAPIERAK